jgi:hypothetical protein
MKNPRWWRILKENDVICKIGKKKPNKQYSKDDFYWKREQQKNNIRGIHERLLS